VALDGRLPSLMTVGFRPIRVTRRTAGWTAISDREAAVRLPASMAFTCSWEEPRRRN